MKLTTTCEFRLALTCLAVVFVATLACRSKHNPFVSRHIRRVDARPEEVSFPGATFNPVKWSRSLRIPGFPKAYNPSLVVYEDGYLLSARCDSVSKDGIRNSHLVLVRLDAEFNVATKPYQLSFVLENHDISNVEDVRLFWFEGRLWAIFNSINKVAPGTQRMHVAELIATADDRFRIGSLVMLRSSEQRVEKNWTPFVVDSDLYVVYSISPEHRIMRPDLESGQMTEMRSTKGFYWDYGVPHGGTPALRYNDKFISIFHGATKTVFKDGSVLVPYAIAAYTFSSKPPFAIEGYTPNAVDAPGMYDFSRNPRKIVFASGMVIRGDTAFVVSGINDDAMLLSSVDLKLVEKALVPVD